MPGSRSRGSWVVAALCAVAIAGGALLEYRVPWLNDAPRADAVSDSPLRLSEIMSSNASALLLDGGATPDWVEIENAGAESVNLRGYTLREVGNVADVFTFPARTLAPGEFAVVYADGTGGAADGGLHARFKLSAAGVGLELRDAEGALVDAADVPALQSNDVYRRGADGIWEVGGEYTPGLANARENHEALAGARADLAVEISEVMALNVGAHADAAGRYWDYVELRNASDEAADLSGCGLSDSADDILGWRFPQGTVLAPGGYLLVYASDGAEGAAGELHAGFKLASAGEELLLSDRNGVPVDALEFPALAADQAYSKRADGTFTTALAPTPGAANTAAEAEALVRATAGAGVCVNELMASSSDTEHDWLELYNGSSEAFDLSGCYLSDEADHPRKWQFPAGTRMQPGQHMGLFLSGLVGESGSGVLHVGFKLSRAGGYTLLLTSPDGATIDRLFVPEQFTGVAYARMADGTFRYVDAATPAAPNAGDGYLGKAERPVFSVLGGLYGDGETVSLEISAAAGARVYYTLDCQDPDEGCALYTGPIEISATTVVRARACEEGMLPSYAESQTYLFGVSHSMRVVSLAADPEDLQGENGIYENYGLDDEREGHVEVYAEGGDRILTANCGLRLHGADSRKLPQKGIKVIAGGEYGDSRFEAALFTNRDYAIYQSFVLRSSSEDGPKTRMRDSILTKLADGTGVMYQETELCVVYINGQYWGHYNMRERINRFSICQFEGWEGDEGQIDLVRGNSAVMRGSDKTYQDMLAWVKKNGVQDEAALSAVGDVIDIDNYIAYHALEIFVGNADTLNVKRYRNPNADGRWRYVVYDLDWGFYVDTDSVSRWLAPGGMGAGKRTDNTLFIALMKNADFRDRFLTFIGERMAADWTSERIVAAIEERYYALLPELPAQFARWNQTEANFREELAKFVNYAKARPTKLLGYFRKKLKLSDADMERYFGDAMRAAQGGSAL